jgi:hypothetical protein
MSSHYEQDILDFIIKNQPTNRKQVLNTFKHLSQKTVYRHIANLRDEKKIFLDNDGFLIGDNPNKPLWATISHLREFRNLTEMSNAYAQQSEDFVHMRDKLLGEHTQAVALFLIDLTIILTSKLEGFALSDSFDKETHRPIDKQRLRIAFEQLENAIKNYEV